MKWNVQNFVFPYELLDSYKKLNHIFFDYEEFFSNLRQSEII